MLNMDRIPVENREKNFLVFNYKESIIKINYKEF